MKHYEEGAKKRGIALPTKPVIFMKTTTALNSHGGEIWRPNPRVRCIQVDANCSERSVRFVWPLNKDDNLVADKRDQLAIAERPE